MCLLFSGTVLLTKSWERDAEKYVVVAWRYWGVNKSRLFTLFLGCVSAVQPHSPMFSHHHSRLVMDLELKRPWSFIAQPKGLKDFSVFLIRRTMIQYANKSHFVIGNGKKTNVLSKLFMYLNQILADLVKKMLHYFWTKFGHSAHSDSKNKRKYVSNRVGFLSRILV